MEPCDNPNCGACYPGMGCHRELKPGVPRLNHTLLDHVDYNEEWEAKQARQDICPSRDDAQPHIFERDKEGTLRCALCLAPHPSQHVHRVDKSGVTP